MTVRPPELYLWSTKTADHQIRLVLILLVLRQNWGAGSTSELSEHRPQFLLSNPQTLHCTVLKHTTPHRTPPPPHTPVPASGADLLQKVTAPGVTTLLKTLMLM